MPTLSGRSVKRYERNRDGSYSARANRRLTLLAAGRPLRELGYRLNHPKGLKLKHVEVKHLQDQGQSTGTLKNKLGALPKSRPRARNLGRRHCRHPARRQI